MKHKRGFLNPWLDLFTREREACPVCGEIDARVGGFRLCAICLDAIPWITRTVCVKCGRAEACPDCQRRTSASFVVNRSAVRYNPLMKEWLTRYKYAGDEKMEKVLAWMMLSGYERLLHEACGGRIRGVFDAITYVPLSPLRMEERGFNQSARLAESLAREIGVPVVPLLAKTKETSRQSQKERWRRMSEIRGAYAVDSLLVRRLLQEVVVRTPRRSSLLNQPQQLHRFLRPLRILLVDDVYTTGSTVDECARTLRRALPCRVWALTWARS